MKYVKTAELTGAALDWAVAKCEEPTDGRLTVIRREDYIGQPVHRETYKESYQYEWWSPSRIWAQGEPIIERERIEIIQGNPLRFTDGTQEALWIAKHEAVRAIHPNGVHGPTPLIAAMRCFVASKLGDDISVPLELL